MFLIRSLLRINLNQIMNSLDSINENVLKTLKVEDLKLELKFRMLPYEGLKD